MNKELPKDWEGTFFKKTEASLILNMTAEEFLHSLQENNSEDVKFFMAGAIFDFGWNDCGEKAEELTRVAKNNIEAPYEQIIELIKSGKEEVECGMDEDRITSELYGLIGNIFEDRKSFVSR